MKLHLGCGNYHIPGWINCDIYPPADKYFDIVQPMPFEDNSVDFIYSEHFLEHISVKEAKEFLLECVRILKVGGILRLSTPDLDVLVMDYVNKKLDRWDADKWHPETPCQLMNEGMRSWGHQFIYDEPELLALFKSLHLKAERQVYHESKYLELKNIESRTYCGELIYEVAKS